MAESKDSPTFHPKQRANGLGWIIEVIWPDGQDQRIEGFFDQESAERFIRERSREWIDRELRYLR
jgi:hypothetical protein